jgi:methylphosphotriester-DNA--protein-cysteine methyltransferase
MAEAVQLPALEAFDTARFASANSDKFHLLNCKYAQQISAQNLVHFACREEAIAAGYVPCEVCKP